MVREIVETLPVGVALDAACGTGRYAEFLAERGHRVIGVDGSPDMLARACTRVPPGEFLLGDLHPNGWRRARSRPCAALTAGPDG